MTEILLTRVIRDKEKLRRVCGITVRVLEPKDIGKWKWALRIIISGTETEQFDIYFIIKLNKEYN